MMLLLRLWIRLVFSSLLHIPFPWFSCTFLSFRNIRNFKNFSFCSTVNWLSYTASSVFPRMWHPFPCFWTSVDLTLTSNESLHGGLHLNLHSWINRLNSGECVPYPISLSWDISYKCTALVGYHCSYVTVFLMLMFYPRLCFLRFSCSPLPYCYSPW